MSDSDCVLFLQWVLPKLRMRWSGFRRVRGQVCKHLERRRKELDLQDITAYRHYLQQHPKEWQVLDSLCRVSITRFYRDKAVFAFLAEEVLPSLIHQVQERSAQCLRLWSAGCASGEEPYSLALVWHLGLQNTPQVGLHILATDADSQMIARARKACYPFSSVKNLPQSWRASAFNQSESSCCLKSEYCGSVEFSIHDVRSCVPNGPFDLILCRNLAFTYFEETLQTEILLRMRKALVPGGVLAIGVHESLPSIDGLTIWSERLGIYRRL